MIDLNEIHSLSDFQRNARAHIARIKQTGKPLVLTVNGAAEVVIQDARAYQKLLEELEEAQTHAAIAMSLEQKKRGEMKDALQAIEDIRKELKLPRAEP
jgi:PHD/YefM family antitoxin component YafN of YafNO toxin-antitoxin module